MKPHPCLDILSAKANNTGYSFNIEFLKGEKLFFESGVSKFQIKESISKLFEMNFDITLTRNEFTELCQEMMLQGDLLTLENISSFFYFKTVHAQLRDAKLKTVREFNGFISSTHASSFIDGETPYINISFTAQPIPWFMQKANCYRAYVDKTVKEIIEDVFKDFCLDSYLSIEYKTIFVLNSKKKTNRINCVQYGESHWDFILRLLDEEDWNYTFVHNEKKCELFIFDDIQVPMMKIPGNTEKSLEFEIIDNISLASTGSGDQTKKQKEYLSDLSFENHGTPSHIEVIDSDYREHGQVLKSSETKPKFNKERPTPLKLKWLSGFEGSKKYKINNDLSINPEEKSKGLEIKKAKDCYLAKATTNSIKAYLGSLISAKYSDYSKKIFTGKLQKLENYRVQDLHFTFKNNSSHTNNISSFSTSITLHPMDTEYGIEQEYERNYIDGTTQGKVIADDKKIYLDDKFYIKISLPWQYDGLPVKSKFIFARYMSPWASQNYGVFVTPRHDDEVLIAFEDGDPDLPVVLGSMYNSKRKYPVDFKKKKHVLAIYDQPSENKKNNFLEMDHKTATVNIAASEHMKIRSFGDHLTQSKLTMKMITSKNMLSTSKEQMEFMTEKNMLSTSKEQMESKTEKNMLLESKKQMEFITEKNMFASSKEQMEFITEKSMLHDSKEQMEFKTDNVMQLDSKKDMSFNTEKNIFTNAKEKIVLDAQKELEILVGSSSVNIDSSGKISIKCTQLSIDGGGVKVELV